MEYQPKTTDVTTVKFILPGTGNSKSEIADSKPDALQELLKLYSRPELDDLMVKLGTPAGKRSFLVFKKNKYFNILIENIAFFYFRHDSSILVTFDMQEYFVNHSLDQLQHLLTAKQFFRINRQYLINFNAVTEAEHYSARKLLLKPAIPTKHQLIVSKERVNSFLHWLDSR